LSLQLLGAGIFATVAKSFGSRIIDAGVKGRVHYIEVHYDSDDEDLYEDAALDASLE